MAIVITVLAAILAIAATVLAYIFIIPEKKREKLNGIGKLLHDTLNFKFLVLEKVLQALYVLSTAYVLLMGFFMLFYVQPGYEGYYYSYPSKWYGGYGLLLMIFGPIAVRLAYEALMMAFLLVKNVIQINNKLKSDVDTAPENGFKKNEYFARRPAPRYAPPAPQYGAPQYAPHAAPQYGAPAAPQYAPQQAPQHTAPASQYAAPAAPATVVCPKCGAVGEKDAFCTTCGTRL